MSTGKRKRHQTHKHPHEQPSERNPNMYILAHEATIIRGTHSKTTAESLEISANGLPKHKETALIRCGSETSSIPPPLSTVHSMTSSSGVTICDDDDPFAFPSSTTTGATEGDNAIWVDRFDIRLLLDHTPAVSDPPTQPTSPDLAGFSDLDSDAEDTYFMDNVEQSEHSREKRRKYLDEVYERRVHAREIEEADENNHSEEPSWPPDELPNEAQFLIMRRTAASLLAASDGTQLEMRILMSHGSDPRFAFLRGRWKDAWNSIKGEGLRHKNRHNTDQKESSLGLADYGSDEESDGPT